MSPTKTAGVINGVAQDRLQQTVSQMRRDPGSAAFQFRVRNTWLGGAHNRSRIQDFYGGGKEDDTRQKTYVMDCDEPPILLGKAQGPNPVAHLLHALAGCVTTALVMHAAARGIEIQSVTSELEGDIDVRGFLGLSPDVPRGFKNIRVTMHVQSDAPPEKLRELAEYSPVFNTIANATPVEISIDNART